MNIVININNLSQTFAHRKDGKAKELLSEHLDKTIKYFYKINEIKGIEDCLDNIIESITINGKKLGTIEISLIKEMFVNAIYLHDIGKINPAYQWIKMENSYIKTNLSYSRHSILSSLIYIDIFHNKINGLGNRKIKKFLEYLLYLFAYCISKHHSNTIDLNQFLDDLQEVQKKTIINPEYISLYKNSTINELDFSQEKNFFYAMANIQKKEDYPYMEVYILVKVLYSSLVSSDFYATYDYMNSDIFDFGLIIDIDKFKKEYESSEVYLSIMRYRSYLMKEIEENPYANSPINQLRTEIFLESEKNLLKNVNSNIFYLEAPTGSGKTNTSINLALRLLEKHKNLNKIFYIFPFNTLIEQTKTTLNSLFKSYTDEIVEINSITPIKTKYINKNNEIEENMDYEEYLLNRQFLHYPIVLTSHVNFFNYLFGTGKEDYFPLVHLCNSVIIIDEIQSYRNDIWKEIIIFLDKYAKLLNMKIIIMSATLPKLDNLIDKRKSSTFIDLIDDKWKYYNNKIFKNRVLINYELLKLEKITIEDLVYEVNRIWVKAKEARIIIEFISRKKAREFFNEFKKKYPNKLMYELTGDDNKFQRREILNSLREKEEGKYLIQDVLVVATQVIEAGVDIDMDIGFKDISILDSEEQFLGRINRSSERKGYVYFFNLTNQSLIYKDDHRIDMNLLNQKYQRILETKDFDNFYEECFFNIEEKKSELNKNNIENLIQELRFLQFKNIRDRMKLINDNNYQIYLPYRLEINGETIDGKEEWEEYKELIYNNNMRYAEKKIKLSQLFERMNLFIYNVKDEPLVGVNKLGNIYYIQNGEKYIIDGKFDRAEFEKDQKELFL